VRDGRAVGSRRRSLGIDVDPLVVTGSVSERVNPELVDCQPIAGTQGLTNRRANLVHARKAPSHAAARDGRCLKLH
jgi:hypothetical protein